MAAGMETEKNMANVFKKISSGLKNRVSPVFIFILCISAGMWLLTKLSYTYVAPIPVSVEVEGNNFEVECIVKGTGYRIVAHRFFKRHKDIKLTVNDVQIYPSVFNEGWYSISAHSLQAAISSRTSDVTVESVDGIPEIRLNHNL